MQQIWLPVTCPRGRAPRCRLYCRIAHGHTGVIAQYV